MTYDRSHTQYYRPKAMKQMLHFCNSCGQTENRLVVHHIDGNDSNHAIENLILLCDKCHRRVHTMNSWGRPIDRLTDELPLSSFDSREVQDYQSLEVDDDFYETVGEIAKQKNTTRHDAIRQMCRDGGYDV